MIVLSPDASARRLRRLPAARFHSVSWREAVLGARGADDHHRGRLAGISPDRTGSGSGPHRAVAVPAVPVPVACSPGTPRTVSTAAASSSAASSSISRRALLLFALARRGARRPADIRGAGAAWHCARFHDAGRAIVPAQYRAVGIARQRRGHQLLRHPAGEYRGAEPRRAGLRLRGILEVSARRRPMGVRRRGRLAGRGGFDPPVRGQPTRGGREPAPIRLGPSAGGITIHLASQNGTGRHFPGPFCGTVRGCFGPPAGLYPGRSACGAGGIRVSARRARPGRRLDGGLACRAADHPPCGGLYVRRRRHIWAGDRDFRV